MKKKVAIIIERANIALGGAERSIFELAGALSSLGFDVDILAATGQTSTKNIHILCPDTGKRTNFTAFAQVLEKHLAENHYDIIHSVLPFEFAHIYQPRGGSFAESILRNAASYQNKLLASFKKITAFANFRRSELLRAEKNLCKNPDGPVIAALSQYVAEQFKQHYGLDEKRIAIIPNGVKTNKQPDKNKADRFRTQILTELRLKEADEPVLFLFVAHNFRLKGLAVLIKAINLVTNQHTPRPACLIVAGRGSAFKYRHLAKALNIHRQIVFLGPVPNIQNVLSISDVAVLPTFYDPSSRFTLEALAADKPVITTKFNGATDLFVDNRHGKVIDCPENIHALAEAISYFTNTDNLQKAADAIVADNLRENISISRAAKQLQSLYESILEKRRL